MITGEIKNKIDQIWDTFFVAGITNPITVLEQMTYIFFMKLLDDKQLQEEENARDWGAEIRQNNYDLSINKYKEIEREKVEYEPVADILSRLEKTEGEYLKGYSELYKMLEGK